MRFKLAIFIFSILGSSCVSGPPSYKYLNTHPEFEPLTVDSEGDTIQFSWYVSWKPLVHMRLTKDSQHVFIDYSVSKDFVSPLRRKRVNIDKWNEIDQALNSIGFWAGYGKCAELAFQEDRDYVETNGDCEEILVMDGASVSLEAKRGSVIVGTKQTSGAGYQELRDFAKYALDLGNIKYR